MKKTVTPFTAQYVTLDTTLSFKDVISRLDQAVNKAGSATFLPRFREVKSKEDIESLIRGITGDHDFLYFQETLHSQWLDIYNPSVPHPGAVVYTIGNPLFAQNLMSYDIHAGLHVPLRIMILEKADGAGTEVVYNLPSSLIVTPTSDPQLKAAAEGLDAKLDAMLTEVVSEHASL